MRVSEDYSSKLKSVTWLAGFPKEHSLKELAPTVAGVRLHEFNNGESKYVLNFVNKNMEVVVNKTNAVALANDLGDDTDGGIGDKAVPWTSIVQTPNGLGPISRCVAFRPLRNRSRNPLQHRS